MLSIKRIDSSYIDELKPIFKDVFSSEPWDDDWSDDNQLTNYLLDLSDNKPSLCFALYDEGTIIGASLGSIIHWYQGTEYRIDELFIARDKQGSGFGKSFVKMIEQEARKLNIKSIFLITGEDVPAYDFYHKLGFSDIPTNISLYKNIS